MTRPAEGVLDTSAVIRLSEIADPERLPEAPLISAVALAELGWLRFRGCSVDR